MHGANMKLAAVHVWGWRVFEYKPNGL